MEFKIIFSKTIKPESLSPFVRTRSPICPPQLQPAFTWLTLALPSSPTSRGRSVFRSPTDHSAPSSAREPPLAGCFLLFLSNKPQRRRVQKSASPTSVSATALRSKTLGLPLALVLVPVFDHFHHENLQRKWNPCRLSHAGASFHFSDGGSEEEAQRGAGEGGGEGAEAGRRGAGFAHPEGPATVSEMKALPHLDLKKKKLPSTDGGWSG